MKPKNKSFKIAFLFLSLVLACDEGEQNVNSDLESHNPMEGIWENKSYTTGYKDTVITSYQFLADSQFEYGQTQFKNGQYEDTIYEGGSYSIPVSSLLLLSFKYGRQGDNQYTLISRKDTLVFTIDKFVDLILWGTLRTFKQISGLPGKLRQGTFYNIKKHFDVYIQSKFEFREDSAYFYSTFTTELEEPSEWPEPFKYRVTAFGGLMTFYTSDGRTTSNGYALYKSNLFFTYTQQRYRHKY